MVPSYHARPGSPGRVDPGGAKKGGAGCPIHIPITVPEIRRFSPPGETGKKPADPTGEAVPAQAALVRVSNGNLAVNVALAWKDEDLVEELYLTFLSRRPSDAELTTGVAFLAKAAARSEAVEDLAWMCINRVEFLFSY